MSGIKYYPSLDGNPRRLRLLYFLLSLFTLLLLLGLNLLAFSYYSKEGTRSRDAMATYNVNLTDHGQLLTPQTGFRVGPVFQIAIMDFDPIHNILKINTKVSVEPPGADTSSLGNGTLLLGTYRSTLFKPKYAPFIDQDATIIVNGDSAKYPFDTYLTTLPFSATTSSVLADPNAAKIPFGAYAFSSMQNFRFHFAFHNAPSANIIYLAVTIKRPPTTKGFAVFIVVIMWCLTLGVLAATFQIVFRRREVSPPLLGVFVALLFALPAVRNTQPAAPPIGTLLDTVSLFWNMMIVALCAITLMAMWIVQSPRPHPPAKSYNIMDNDVVHPANYVHANNAPLISNPFSR